MPSNKDIEDAKKFLLKRLNAEQSMSRNLETELLIFANKLIALYHRYGYTPSVTIARYDESFQRELALLIQNFKDALYDDVSLLCVADNSDDKDNILAYINLSIAGLTLKDRISTWVDQYVSSMQKTDMDKPLSKVSIRVGAGYGIDRLLRQTIADAYMHEWKNQHPGAVGYYSYRGSSYPCSLCDDEVGYHPIEDYPPYGNYHPNCVCILVFVYTPPQ